MAMVAMAPEGRESGALLLANRLGSGGGVAPRVNPTVPPPAGTPSTISAGPGAPAAGAAGLPVSPPSVLPTYSDPLAGFNFNPGAFMGGGAGASTFTAEGGYTPGTIDTTGDAGFEAFLKGRMQGEGMASWEQVYEGTFTPYKATLDREAARAMDVMAEQMVSRGMLDSSEAGRNIADIALEAEDKKMAFLGELGMRFEAMRQEGINTAIAQYGILEGNKLQAKTTITAANISASAQIRSAALQSGATVQAAQIGAQARLQEAGLNAQVALESLRRQLDSDLVSQGIDPVAFSQDPEYRGSVFKYYADLRQQEIELGKLVYDSMWETTYGQPRP